MNDTRSPGGPVTTPPDPDEMLMAGQAAAILGVTTGTMKRWGDRGWIPYTRYPSGYRYYRRADVEATRERIDNGDLGTQP